MLSHGQRGFLHKLAVLLLVFSPAVLCAVYVANCAVNVPVADDWGRAELLAQREAGELNLARLAAPTAAGDRPLLPRALALNLYALTDGNLLAEIALIFVAHCVAAGCFFWLLCRTLATTTSRVITGLAINLALFSPVAYENLLWASRLGSVLPVAFLAIALVAAYSGLPVTLKTAVCGLAALAATLCAISGFGVWVAVFLVGWCGAGGLAGRARLGFLSSITALSAITWLLYAQRADISFGGSVESIFNQLGSPLARFFSTDLRDTAAPAGRVILVLFAAGLGLLGWRWQIAGTRKALGLWLAVGSYAVVAVALSALVGDHDVVEAVQPRYITNAMMLLVSLIGAGAVLLTRWAEPDRESDFTPAARLAIGAAVGGVALAMSWPGWVYGSRKMEQWKNARMQARASLMYWNHHGLQYPGRIDPDSIRMAKALPYLHSKGWIKPAPLDEFTFGDFILDPKRMAPSDFKNAMIREVRFEDGLLYARGHAALPGSLRSAHGIVATWRRDKTDPWKLVAFAEPRGQSVAERLFADTNYGMGPNLARPKQFSKWVVNKPWPDAPPGRFELGAWMFDVEKMRAYPLDGSVRLGKKVKREGSKP